MCKSKKSTKTISSATTPKSMADKSLRSPPHTTSSSSSTSSYINPSSSTYNYPSTNYSQKYPSTNYSQKYPSKIPINYPSTNQIVHKKIYQVNKPKILGQKQIEDSGAEGLTEIELWWRYFLANFSSSDWMQNILFFQFLNSVGSCDDGCSIFCFFNFQLFNCFFFLAGCLLCLLSVLFVALANGNINGHISNLPLQKQSVGMATGLLPKMKKPFWLPEWLLCWRRKLTQKS